MAEVVFHATAPSEKQAEALLRGAEPFLLHAPEFFTTVLDYEVASDLPELIRDVMTEWKGKEVVVRSVGDPGRLAISLLLLACASAEYRKDEEPLLEIRSRFGVNRVEVGGSRSGGFFYPLTRLVHGNTMHAKQFEVVGLESVPTAYYHRHGPVGQVFRTYNTDPTRAFAVLDLGGGTMASYGLPGQTVDFFEVDPALADISFHSHRYFSFVREAERSRANVSLIVGDARSTFTTKAAQARLKPNRERGESLPGSFKYRLVVVDTLGPSPRPGHMAAKVTREAVRGYFDRLEEDGVVLIHISSRFFDLQPVLANVAADLGLAGYHWSDSDSDIVGKNSSHWVALARKPAHLDKVLSVPRWTADLDQLALLGAALWPSHGHTSYQAASGLCHAAQALADLQAQQAHREEGLAGDPRLVRAGWEPLETTAELRRFEADVPGRLRGLDSRRADWNKRLAEPGLAPASKAWLAARVAAVEKETTRLKARLAEVPGKHRRNAKVGVWTDKSANLLDVFAR